MVADSASDFPIPEWAPIQDLESVDLTGTRKDGGIDLIVVVSQPLDASDDTLAAIRGKIRYYLEVVDLPEFQSEMGHPPRDRVSIVMACGFPIHPKALAVIGECQAIAMQRGVKLTVVDDPCKYDWTVTNTPWRSLFGAPLKRRFLSLYKWLIAGWFRH